jgi:hypothetical protein
MNFVDTRATGCRTLELKLLNVNPVKSHWLQWSQQVAKMIEKLMRA